MQPEMSVSTIEGLGPLIALLAEFDYIPSSFVESQSFGDFRVNFIGSVDSLAITRDRSQFMVDGNRTILEPAGLWQAFSTPHSLAVPLTAWLKSRRA